MYVILHQKKNKKTKHVVNLICKCVILVCFTPSYEEWYYNKNT